MYLKKNQKNLKIGKRNATPTKKAPHNQLCAAFEVNFLR